MIKNRFVSKKIERTKIMKACVIDIGSNTIKATVFKVSKNRSKEVVGHLGFKAKIITKIVEENGKRLLCNEGKETLFDCVGKLCAFAEENLCDSIYAFATASLRGVDNAKEIIDGARKNFNIDIEILSGEEEAMCSLRGLLSDPELQDAKEGIMIDMGGGSTEAVMFSNGTDPQIISLPFGCLSLFDSLVENDLPTKEERVKIEELVDKSLTSCSFLYNTQLPLYIIGGSGRAILKVARSGNDKNRVLKREDFATVLQSANDADFLEKAERLVPGRSLTICPAAIALWRITDFIGTPSITVCFGGVREGYLEKILP